MPCVIPTTTRCMGKTARACVRSLARSMTAELAHCAWNPGRTRIFWDRRGGRIWTWYWRMQKARHGSVDFGRRALSHGICGGKSERQRISRAISPGNACGYCRATDGFFHPVEFLPVDNRRLPNTDPVVAVVAARRIPGCNMDYSTFLNRMPDPVEHLMDFTDRIDGDVVCWDVPEGLWRILIFTAHAGMPTSGSCRALGRFKALS